MREYEAGRALRSLLLRHGIRTRRIEDRLGGFPDMLATIEPSKVVFGIETKVWRGSSTPETLGLRPLQVDFARTELLPYFVVGLRMPEAVWELYRVAPAGKYGFNDGVLWRSTMPGLFLDRHCIVENADLHKVCEAFYDGAPYLKGD